MYASDAEDSVYSGPSRAGDYSSLDLPQPGLDTGAVYRNPRFCRTQGHRVGTWKLKKGVNKRMFYRLLTFKYCTLRTFYLAKILK